MNCIRPFLCQFENNKKILMQTFRYLGKISATINDSSCTWSKTKYKNTSSSAYGNKIEWFKMIQHIRFWSQSYHPFTIIQNLRHPSETNIFLESIV